MKAFILENYIVVFLKSLSVKVMKGSSMNIFLFINTSMMIYSDNENHRLYSFFSNYLFRKMTFHLEVFL